MHDQQTGQMFQPARRTRRHPGRRSNRPGAVADIATFITSSTPIPEPLEARRLMAVQAPVELAISPNVNVTRLLENQNEAAIAIDRTNPANLFMGSVNDARGTGPLDEIDANGDGVSDPPPLLKAGELRGLVGARSEDGGVTWTSGTLDADLTGGILPPACCDPSVAYDDFGNLFITFINRELDQVLVAMSTDNGRSFEQVGAFSSVTVDQPTIVTGPNSVWVTFQLDNRIVASGARVLGLGTLDPEQTFENVQEAPRSQDGNFGDIAIGPNGEVMVTYQILTLDPDAVLGDDDTITILDPNGDLNDPDNFAVLNTEGPADIYVNTDPDGFGPESFGARNRVTRTNVGAFDPLPAQNTRTIDAEAGLAWDRSGGPFNGRVWMVYTDEGRDESDSDTEIRVRFSDDNGRTWSSFRNATDEDFTRNSQFLPRIALDQTTGNIAITWHDTRVEEGFSLGPNDETGFWGTVGVPTNTEAGVAFAGNIKISQGLSDAHRSRAVLEYGDYTGLDFHNNVFYPVWGDNSNSTGDNPSGGVNDQPNALATFDVYTARVIVTPTNPVPPEQAPVGPGSPLTPQFIGRDTITKGKFYKFQVRFTSPNGVDASSLDDSDLLVTGPNGYNLFADFQKAKRSRGGTIVTGTYIAPAPGGKWDQGDNGLYSILIRSGAIRDLTSTVSADGLLDQFLVSSTAPPQSPAVLPAAPVSASLQPATAPADEDDLRKAVGL